NDPLAAGELLKFHSSRRPRDTQRDRQIHVVEIQIPEDVRLRIEPHHSGELRLRAYPGRLELETRKSVLRSIAPNRRETMRFHELIRDQRSWIRGAVDLTARSITAS